MTADSQTESRPFSLCSGLYFCSSITRSPTSSFVSFSAPASPIHLEEGIGDILTFAVERLCRSCEKQLFRPFAGIYVLEGKVACLETLDVLCANLGRI